MTTPREQAPVRLLESELEPNVRAVLESARDDNPDDLTLELLRARIRSIEGPSAQDGSAEFSTSHAGGLSARFVIRILFPLALAGVGALVVFASADRARSNARAEEVPVAPRDAAPLNEEVLPSPGVSAVELEDNAPVNVSEKRVEHGPVIEPRTAQSSARARKPSGVHGASASAATHVSGHEPTERTEQTLDELALLERTRQLLRRGEAAQAFELLETHPRLFPSAAFAQERDVLAIEALMILGRIDEARALGERFFEQYARSAHHLRVRSLLDGGS